MPLLEGDELRNAKQELMNNLRRSRLTTRDYQYGMDERTVFERDDGIWVDLGSQRGLFVGRSSENLLTGSFGGQASWQMIEENGEFTLCHTLNARQLPEEAIISQCNGEFEQVALDNRRFFKICTVNQNDAFERIFRFALCCYQARQREGPTNSPPPAGGGCDPGPAVGGERSAATWSAKQSPYVTKIVGALNELGWNKEVDGSPWRPDILRGSCNSGKRILIEVKPDCGMHNVITGVGQVTCYSLGMKNVIKVIAAPGLESLPPYLMNVLESNDIKSLDLAEVDLLLLLRAIIE